MDNKILAVIPARSGSKGLPEKNIKLLINKPLIAWSIQQGQRSKYINDLVVSTDSESIAKISREYGARVPFLRPAHLATDNATTASAIKHVIEELQKMGQSYQYILLLEPTSPIRKKNDIDDAIELLMNNKEADGVISLGEVHMEHPMIMKKIENNKICSYLTESKYVSQRQQTDKAFFPYGVIYMIKVSVFMKSLTFYTNNVIPYFIERWQCYEVDDIYDFVCIESIIKIKLKELI